MMYTQLDIEQNRKKTGRELCFMLLAALPFAALAVAAFCARIEPLCMAAVILCGGVMILLNKTYGFQSDKLAAPQAHAMAAVIAPLMNGQGAPWLLYGIGAVIALVLDRC